MGFGAHVPRFHGLAHRAPDTRNPRSRHPPARRPPRSGVHLDSHAVSATNANLLAEIHWAALRDWPWGFDAGRRRPKGKQGGGSDASGFSALWAPRRSLPRAHPPPDRPGTAPPSPRTPPSETVRVTSESGATGCGQAAARLVELFFCLVFFLFFPRAPASSRAEDEPGSTAPPGGDAPKGKTPPLRPI